MSKVLLIAPPWYRIFGQKGSSCPLGLCYLAGVMEEEGFNVSIYNADFKAGMGIRSNVERTAGYNVYLGILKNIEHPLWQEVETVISRQSPDIVGVSVMTPQYGSALNVANIVKKFDSDVPVVFGGVHPTMLPDETVKNNDVDIVVRGEGEYTFLDLCKKILAGESLNDVLGISYKEGDKIIHNPTRPLIENLDKIPFPARHLLLEKGEYPPAAFRSIFASRGCPYNCIFCASHKVWSKRVRYRSPENIIEEVKDIQTMFKTRYFRFEDDSFTINKKFVMRICDLMVKEKLDIKWECETRADVVTDDLFKKMKAARCIKVDIGIESGDVETLKKIKKGITIEQIMDAKEVLKTNNIRLAAFFMIGFPWETKKEINKTISLMQELDPYVAVFSVVTPYPGTELYDICNSEGLIPEDMDWSTFFHQSPDMYLTKNLTREEARQIIKEVEKTFDMHNKKKEIKSALSNPLYTLERLIDGGYYKPRNLWMLFRYLWK